MFGSRIHIILVIRRAAVVISGQLHICESSVISQFKGIFVSNVLFSSLLSLGIHHAIANN